MNNCPHCGGNLRPYLAAEAGLPPTSPSTPAAIPVSPTPAKPTYDQAKIWRSLMEIAQSRMNSSSPPTLMELVDEAMMNWPSTIDEFPTIVHIVFDQPVVPRGGILHQATMSDGKHAPSIEQLELMGYLVVDGKVVMVDDVPVGPAYGVIQYWGGEKQHKRWHLTKPVKVDPSRNGNPFFMDDEMVAFGATWRDPMKMREALLSLLSTFTTGVGDRGKAIAYPFALLVTPMP